jgi:hypothetical protein
LVNSAFYGFVSGKVTTVTRAVVLLGYDNVRLASLSLLLFEHFKSKTAARELKDATIRSFWCGLVAKEIAKTERNMDSEEAFICALLHQLGKLLIIYHLPEEYRKIQHQMNGNNQKESRAATQVLGLSYHTLGLAVAEQWNFPGSLYKTMTPLTTEILADEHRRIDPLSAVANFTNDLARIVGNLSLHQRDAAVERLISRYQNYIMLSPGQLTKFMDSCVEKLYEHTEALQFTVEESDFLMRLSGVQPEMEKPEDCNASGNGDIQSSVPGEPGFRLAGDQEINTGATFADGQDAVSMIMGGIQEVSGAMLGQYDINDIALMSLEIIYRALQCRRAILFIHDGRRQIMEARFGYGADIQRIVGRVKFETACGAGPDLFSQALRVGKDLIVDDTQAKSIEPLMPSWYCRSIDAKAFIFMPIAYQKICVGAYYADMDVFGTPVDAVEHKYLSMLRNQMILGIKLSR